MSDFLKKFNNQNYKDEVQKKKQKDLSEKTTKKVNKEDVSKHTEDTSKTVTMPLDEVVTEIIEKQKEESKKEEVFEKEEVLSTQEDSNDDTRVDFEEDIVIDQHYHKKKIIQYSIIGGIVLVLCISAFLIFRFVNQVTVPDFINESLSTAQTWAVKNNIELKIEREYNLDYDYNLIFEQSKDGDKKIQKGSVLTIKVSDGADPDEVIVLPDFTTMTKTEIETWKSTNKAENLKIVQEYNEEVEKDKVIKVEFKDTSVTNETYRRKDTVSVYVSKGVEVYEKNIEVPDFKNKTKAEVETWATTNEITMTYEESDSDTITEGCIISQSVTAGEKVAKKDEMTVYVSTGKASIVPNFYNVTMEEAEIYATNANIALVTKQQYSTSVSYGKLISQSVSSGTKLTGDSRIVTVVYSIGKPYIDVTGQTEKSLQEYFYNFQSKGASITYSVNYVDSYEGTKGNVISANYNNEFVNMDTHVVVDIGRGNLPAPQVEQEKEE